MVGDEGEIVVEERLQPSAHHRIDHARVAVPEEAVVHEHNLGAGVGRALEELPRG